MLVPSSDVAASTACDREDDHGGWSSSSWLKPRRLVQPSSGCSAATEGSAIHPKLSSDRAAGIIPEYPVIVIERIMAAPADRARP